MVGKTLTDEEFYQYLKDVEAIDRKYKIIYEKEKKILTGERDFLPFEEHKALIDKIHRNLDRAINRMRKSKYGLGKKVFFHLSKEKQKEYLNRISREDREKYQCRIFHEVPWRE